MKLLNNPWVSGPLAVLAVSVVSYQLLPPRWQPRAAAAPASQAAAPVGTSAPGGPPPQPDIPTPACPPTPVSPLDSAFLEAHLAEWIDQPKRDPFLLIHVQPQKTAMQLPSPLVYWRLKAIWRQTGGRVAAINDGIYTEGERIQGYKIERIEGDQVLLSGPNGLERLGFAQTEGSAANHGRSGPNPGKKSPSHHG